MKPTEIENQVSEMVAARYKELSPELKEMLERVGNKTGKTGTDVLAHFLEVTIAVRENLDILSFAIPMMFPQKKLGLLSLQIFLDLNTAEKSDKDIVRLGADIIGGVILKKERASAN